MTDAPALLVDTRDPTPPYEQLRRQLAGLVGSGVLAPGDRLPPVRQVAADLGLAVGTVARAYRELEAAGLVRARRGGGTRVRELARPEASALRGRQLRADAEALVSRARRAGATDDDVRAAVAAALARPA